VDRAAAAAPAITLGPIIHNPQMVEMLRQKGVNSIDRLEDIPSGSKVVIRSHGVGKSEMDALQAKGCEIIDATCPFVRRIHEMAKSASECKDVLSVLVGNDERDGTMHADGVCKSALGIKKVKKVALLDMGVKSAELDLARSELEANGIEVASVDAGVIESASAAWNILMCAELCNNVSRFDGIKYGYRAKNYKNLDELYTNSRTEAFGELVKTAILYGSDVLSSNNYMSKYDKAMRVRRVIAEAFTEIFKEYDAVMLPACSKTSYTASDDVFVENKYTAPASVTGLPAVVAGGVQLVGKAFSDGALLDVSAILTKEGK